MSGLSAMQTRGRTAALAAWLIITAQGARAENPKCDGTAFYPEDKSTVQIYIDATVAGDRIVPAALDVLPFANAKTITPLGQSREMQPKDLAGLDIGYRYDGHTMVARTIKTSAYYPSRRRDVPTLALTIGKLELVGVSRRDPTEPKLNDAYAQFDLVALPGLYHPGETALLRVIDATGGELARITFPIPGKDAFDAGLRAALANLRLHCEAVADNPDGLPF